MLWVVLPFFFRGARMWLFWQLQAASILPFQTSDVQQHSRQKFTVGAEIYSLKTTQRISDLKSLLERLLRSHTLTTPVQS